MSEDNEITYWRHSKKQKRKCKQRIVFSSKLLSSTKGTNKVIDVMNSGNIISNQTTKISRETLTQKLVLSIKYITNSK